MCPLSCRAGGLTENHCRLCNAFSPLPFPRPAAAAFSDVQLSDRLLTLCHLSVAPLMRGALSHLGAMQASLAGLRAIGRQGAGAGGVEETRMEPFGWGRGAVASTPLACTPSPPAPPHPTPRACPAAPTPHARACSEQEERGGQMLSTTRRQCQSEFSRSLRSHEWAQVGGWARQGGGAAPC